MRLKKISLILSIALVTGILSSTASANFSVLDEPLEGDFFVGIGSSATAFPLPDSEIPNQQDVGGVSLGQLFIGKNLVNEDNLVAGILGEFDRTYNFQFRNNGINRGFAQWPVSKTVGLNAYVVHCDDPDHKIGLKLGALARYTISLLDSSIASEQEEEENQSGGSSIQAIHGIGGKVFESYTLKLTDMGSVGVLLTQFGEVNAVKLLGGTNPNALVALNGGLKLAFDINGFEPFLSAHATKAFVSDQEAKPFVPAIGAGFSWKIGSNTLLKLDVSRTIGDVKAATADLGLSLVF